MCMKNWEGPGKKATYVLSQVFAIHTAAKFLYVWDSVDVNWHGYVGLCQFLTFISLVKKQWLWLPWTDFELGNDISH